MPGTQAPLGGAPNVNLQPEQGDTFSLGAVFQAMGFTGSVDYYRIKVTDMIRVPDPEPVHRGCFNYLTPSDFPNADPGGETTRIGRLDPESGRQYRRAAGAAAALGGDSNSNFIAINRGSVDDFGHRRPARLSPADGLPLEESSLSLNLLVNYLIDFEEEELPGVNLEYAGTACYFGQGLSAGGGCSHPRWKGTLNAAWRMDPISLISRIRYIDGMGSRPSVQFPGETTSPAPARSGTSTSPSKPMSTSI